MDLIEASRELINAVVLAYALAAGVLVVLLLVLGLLVAIGRGIVHGVVDRRARTQRRPVESLAPALTH